MKTRTLSRMWINLTYILVGLTPCSCLAGPEAIRGTVTDPSGAVIPGVLVQLRVSGKSVAETTTAATGDFLLPIGQGNACRRLSAGACDVIAGASGFAPASQTLRPSDLSGGRISLILEIAPYRQDVEVVARMPLITNSLDMSGVRESSAKDVGEALTSVDGVWRIRKGGIANDLVIRGFQQNNINVLVEGSRTYGACPGHMDPPAQHVDFAQVDHVDITKGAFDVFNQGSLGAVVNITNKSPSLGFALKPSFGVGSFGYYNPSMVASYGSRTFRMLGGYSYRTSEPYKDGSGRPFTDYASYSLLGKQQKSFDIHTGWLETGFSPSDRQEIKLSYMRQQAGLILYPYLSMDSDHDNADRAMVKYSAREISSSVRALRVETYFTQVKHFMSDSQRASAMNGLWNMASSASSRAIGGRVEVDLGRDLTAGFESYYRNWDVLGYMKMGMMMSTTPSVPDISTQALGSFVDYHHALSDNLRISGGLRFDHASMRVNSPAENTDLYVQFHNTRLTSNDNNYSSGNVRLSLRLPHSMDLFTGIGTTGRIPDAAERYFSRGTVSGTTVGNPLLPLTRNTELSTGINLSQGRLYVRPVLFYSFLNDYIIVNNQPQLNALGMGMGSSMDMMPATARSYTNVDARIYGGEVAYGYSFTNAVSLNGGSSYSRGVAEPKMSANVMSTNLPEMPPLRTWAALRYTHRWAYFELGGVATTRQSLIDADLKETPTAGYGLLNFRLGFTYRRLSASLAVDNLLNHFYYEYLSYYRNPFGAGIKVPEPGRNGFLQLRYSF